MRVVSLVPSWTETLLEAGVNVVGRTRFCIHPRTRVADIPRVGGTKDWNFEQILKLKPDLLILDREENPKWMAEQTEVPWHATHVTSPEDMPATLAEMARVLGNEELKVQSERWRRVLAKPQAEELPGVLGWGFKPDQKLANARYVIWRDPWMCASRDTFIGGMLARFGIELERCEERYPRFEMESLPASTLLLFSSEPYPFWKKREELKNLPFAHVFVDGECFSWFGSRALRVLEGLPNR